MSDGGSAYNSSVGSALWPAAAVAITTMIGPLTSGRPTPSGAHQQVVARFEGEYGLWVSEDVDLVEVHWITRRAGAGFLRVLVQDTVRYGFETALAFFHEATFPKLFSGRVTLQYGSSVDIGDQHITAFDLYAAERPREPWLIEGVDSLYIVGDVHGRFDSLVRLLSNAGLIDRALRWMGGRRHLVFLGDIFDRGIDVTRTLWFIYELERQAEAEGGGVHTVLGNHELLVMANDLRYVAGKEKLIADYYGTNYATLFDTRFSVLGKWLASKVGILRIDNILLAHGGVSETYLDFTLESFDDSLIAFFGEDLFRIWADSTAPAIALDSAAVTRRAQFFFGDSSVFWYRGYVKEDTLEAMLANVLDRFGGTIHVVGHTTVPTIQERYGGALIAVGLEEPASEMLLLVREPEGYARFRYPLQGAPEPLSMPQGARSGQPDGECEECGHVAGHQ